MQRRLWKQLAKRTAGALSLFAVPAVALACFAPSAFTALATPAVSAQQVATPVAAAPQASGEVLQGWTDTQSSNTVIDAFLIQQAKSISLSLGTQVSSLVTQQTKLTQGTLQFNLLLQQLVLISTEQTAWNASYRKTFVKGSSSNLTALQNSLINLQVQFMNAQTTLTVTQTTQIQQTGSTSTITPPKFTF